VPADRINRITPDHLARERRALGESWFRQEYCCSFEALEGLVYPDFARCVVPGLLRRSASTSAASISACATLSPPSGPCSTRRAYSGSPASISTATNRSPSTPR